MERGWRHHTSSCWSLGCGWWVHPCIHESSTDDGRGNLAASRRRSHGLGDLGASWILRLGKWKSTRAYLLAQSSLVCSGCIDTSSHIGCIFDWSTRFHFGTFFSRCCHSHRITNRNKMARASETLSVWCCLQPWDTCALDCPWRPGISLGHTRLGWNQGTSNAGAITYRFGHAAYWDDAHS